VLRTVTVIYVSAGYIIVGTARSFGDGRGIARAARPNDVRAAIDQEGIVEC